MGGYPNVENAVSFATMPIQHPWLRRFDLAAGCYRYRPAGGPAANLPLCDIDIPCVVAFAARC
eukprot:scaffold6801_cov112-Isochrysis_galbana.AAC.1